MQLSRVAFCENCVLFVSVLALCSTTCFTRKRNPLRILHPWNASGATLDTHRTTLTFIASLDEPRVSCLASTAAMEKRRELYFLVCRGTFRPIHPAILRCSAAAWLIPLLSAPGWHELVLEDCRAWLAPDTPKDAVTVSLRRLRRCTSQAVEIFAWPDTCCH